MRRYTRTTATTGETKSEERRVTRLRMRPCCERIWGACVDAAAHARCRAPQEKEEPRRGCSHNGRAIPRYKKYIAFISHLL